jgi:AcrR family transcriptional regulator
MPRTRSPEPRHGYHHGDLRAALIDGAGALLAERGPEGFSLRELARRVGVSPAAPAHHFGDSEGLLVAVATAAFEGLTAALEAGNARGGNDPVARLREQGVGYVGFALRHPGRFALMFRGGHRADAALEAAGHAAFAVLEQGVRELLRVPADAPLAPSQWQVLLVIWSVVHGFAQLALAGQFKRALAGAGPEALLTEVLPGMLQQQIAALVPPHARPATRAAVAPRAARRATSGSR